MARLARRRSARRWLALTVCVALAPGCARDVLVLPIALDAAALADRVPTRPPGGYESAVRSIAAIMVAELGLPLPSRVTAYLFPDRESYAEGLAAAAPMPSWRASEIAGYSLGLGQHRRLFLDDGALRHTCRATWLAVIAHELSHSTQYELSGGRRGRSEQWVREGMADWVAYSVLDRLGESTFAAQRARAARAVARAWPELERRGLDLLVLGQPLGWEARHLGPGGQAQYHLAFLLTDALIRRAGWDRLVEYFKAFAASNDRFANFQRAFGLSLAAFERLALERLGARRASREGDTLDASSPRRDRREQPAVELADPCQ